MTTGSSVKPFKTSRCHKGGMVIDNDEIFKGLKRN